MRFAETYQQVYPAPQSGFRLSFHWQGPAYLPIRVSDIWAEGSDPADLYVGVPRLGCLHRHDLPFCQGGIYARADGWFAFSFALWWLWLRAEALNALALRPLYRTARRAGWYTFNGERMSWRGLGRVILGRFRR